MDASQTPSSYSSTLRRNNDTTKTQTMPKNSNHHQQQQQHMQPPIYDSIGTKPTQTMLTTNSNGNKNVQIGQAISGGTMATTSTNTILPTTNPFSAYDLNTLDYRHLNSSTQENDLHHEPPSTAVTTTTTNQQYHTTANSQQVQQQNQLIDYRQQVNVNKFGDDYRLLSSTSGGGSDLLIANNSNHLNLSNSSIANQLLSNTNSGIGISATSTRTYSSTIGNSNSLNKESKRNHQNSSRNHIITDSLPGPESCV